MIREWFRRCRFCNDLQRRRARFVNGSCRPCLRANLIYFAEMGCVITWPK